jgi:hypothetical protein
VKSRTTHIVNFHRFGLHHFHVDDREGLRYEQKEVCICLHPVHSVKVFLNASYSRSASPFNWKAFGDWHDKDMGRYSHSNNQGSWNDTAKDGYS